MKHFLNFALAAAVVAAIFCAGRGCGCGCSGGDIGSGFGGGCFGGGNGFGCGHAHVPTRIDTVVVRDTIRDTVLVPVRRFITRIDTVLLRVAGDAPHRADSLCRTPADTVRCVVPVEIPIERKVYQTPDYRAVVEGFRPELAEMEIFRNTLQITREAVPPKQRRWGIGVQAGYGIAVRDGKVGTVPYIGIGIQYDILTF